jgi:hypothetical protein
MSVDELKRKLDAIGWREKVDAELSERRSFASARHPVPSADDELRALAAAVDEGMLDRLELEAGYSVWCLRLAFHVDPVAARRRAEPHIDSPNWRLRSWARRVAGTGS